MQKKNEKSACVWAAAVQAFTSACSGGGKCESELFQEDRHEKKSAKGKRKQGRKEQKAMTETKTQDLSTESLFSWQILSMLPTNTTAPKGSSEG